MQSQFQDLVFVRSRDRLLSIVEEEPELLSKILQLHDQGVFHKSTLTEGKFSIDPSEAFPRGESRHGCISLKNLLWLFEESFGLSVETVKNIAARVKLQGARWLWYWALDVDPRDALTGKSLNELKPWVQERYVQQLSKHIAQVRNLVSNTSCVYLICEFSNSFAFMKPH